MEIWFGDETVNYIKSRDIKLAQKECKEKRRMSKEEDPQGIAQTAKFLSYRKMTFID